MSGYEVLEAGNTADILQCLERAPVQVLIVGSDLLAGDAPGMEKVRKRTTRGRIPILAVSNTQAELLERKEAGPNCDDYQLRSERQAMLQSITRLAGVVDSPGLSAGAADFEKADAFNTCLTPAQ